jgi:hypothetical protein
MADEKHPPPRHPTLPRANDPIGDRAQTNDEIIPLGRMGRIDWVKTAKVLAKAIPILIISVATGLVGAYQLMKPMIEDFRKQADERTDKRYDLVRPELDAVKKEVIDLRARLDAASKASPAQPARRGVARRPAAAVSAIPPAAAPPLVPKALPKDPDKPAQPQQSQRGVDSGAP